MEYRSSQEDLVKNPPFTIYENDFEALERENRFMYETDSSNGGEQEAYQQASGNEH